MLLFDSHVHIGIPKITITAENSELLAYRQYQKNSYDSFVKKAIKNGISKAVIFPFPFPEISSAKHNRYIQDAVVKYPYFFIPFYLPDSIDILVSQKHEYFGIKDHFYLDRLLSIDRPALFEFLQAENKFYIFHAHWKHWIEKIKYISNNFPKLRIIIAHAARQVPFSGMDINARLKEIVASISSKGKDNIFLETSTIRDSNAYPLLMNKFGANHVLWGTDFPCYKNVSENTIEEERNCLVTSSLATSDQTQIFSENFRTLFQQEDVWVRIAMKDDSQALTILLNEITPEEASFLSLSKKLPLIKKMINDANHILVAEKKDKSIVGFLRKSDRHENGVMIEEVFISQRVRGNGIAGKLIQASVSAYSSAEVKTFAANHAICSVVNKLGFSKKISPKGIMILWSKKSSKHSLNQDQICGSR